ncbi:hypothetical protein [Singulisphaera sp. PoT]|uniref:hypothetical protein n=1 Tax=Singulisphaera sp. PoT TaxID=3411797 RepID=UPI003BF55EE6
MDKPMLTISLEPQEYGFDFRRTPFVELVFQPAKRMRVVCLDENGLRTELEGPWDVVVERLIAFGYVVARKPVELKAWRSK